MDITVGIITRITTITITTTETARWPITAAEEMPIITQVVVPIEAADPVWIPEEADIPGASLTGVQIPGVQKIFRRTGAGRQCPMAIIRRADETTTMPVVKTTGPTPVRKDVLRGHP